MDDYNINVDDWFLFVLNIRVYDGGMETTRKPPSDEHNASADQKDAGVVATKLPPAGKRRRKHRRWPYAVLLVIVLAGAAAGWMIYRSKSAATGAAASVVETATVTLGAVEKSVSSSCEVISNLDVDIKCRASGEVIELPFDISQTVKKGDLLCQLDPTDEQLTVRAAEATVSQTTAKLAQARYDLEQAKLNLDTTRQKYQATLHSAEIKAANLRAKADRLKQLLGQNLSSKETWETADTDAANAETDLRFAQIAIEELKQQEIDLKYKAESVKTVEAQLQVDQIAFDTQKQQLAYTTVTAPIDGTVSALNVQKGAIIASGTNAVNGGTTIMTLSDLSRIFIIASVDESDIGDVRVGQDVRLTVDSYPTLKFSGRVERIAVQGASTSNVVTFEVKIEVLDQNKNLLKPAMTGNATIIEDQRQNVLAIPSESVIHQGDKILVQMAEGQRREITVGLQGYDYVEVLSGLKDGDRIVTNPLSASSRWTNSSGSQPPPPM